MTKAVVVDDYSHADERHPGDALVVRECIAERGVFRTYTINKDRRYLRVCIIDEDEGIFGFQVVDIINKVAKEKTAFIKDRITCLQDLLEFISERGYSPFTGPF